MYKNIQKYTTIYKIQKCRKVYKNMQINYIQIKYIQINYIQTNYIQIHYIQQIPSKTYVI